MGCCVMSAVELWGESGEAGSCREPRSDGEASFAFVFLFVPFSVTVFITNVLSFTVH